MAVGGVGNLGSSSRLRFFGFASGLDVDEIVQKLMTAERIPLDRLLQRRQLLVWQKEDYQTVRLKLRDLDDNVLNLRLNTTFQARTVSSSDEKVVKASASSGAPLGTHTVTVTSLAAPMSFTSSASISTGPAGANPDAPLAEQFSGLGSSLNLTVTYTVGTDTQTRSRVFDTATQTLSDVMDWLNGLGFKLTASYDKENDRFFLASTETGSRTPDGESVSYTFDSGGASFFTDVLKLQDRAGLPIVEGASYSGTNAQVTLDGANLEFRQNTFTLNGVTYTLVGTGGPATVTVSQNNDGVINAIKSFVDLYNTTIEYINGELREKRYLDYPPLTDAQKKEMSEDEIAKWEEKARSGLLRSDPLLTEALSDLRVALSTPVGGTGSKFSSLADIGITTGEWGEYGKLYLDEDKLRRALGEDLDGVRALFQQKGGSFNTRGVALRLDDALNEAMDKLADRAGVTGLTADSSGIGKQIKLLDERIEVMEDRLARKEEYYYRRFTLMESFISQMNNQALWLGQQFNQFGR